MKNANHRQYGPNTADIDEFNTTPGFSLQPSELIKLKRGNQAASSDSYFLDDSREFCAWGYPMDLDHY
jgi:hypothetical protein